MSYLFNKKSDDKEEEKEKRGDNPVNSFFVLFAAGFYFDYKLLIPSAIK